MAKFTYQKSYSKAQETVHDVTYTEECELPKGKLPTEKDILCCMLYILRNDVTTVSEAAETVAYNLVEHWHLCNIYTIPVSCNFIHITKVSMQIRCFFNPPPYPPNFEL